MCIEYAKLKDLKIDFYQSNIDDIVERFKTQEKSRRYGYKCWWLPHTSVAIHDALKIIKIPIIESHK